MTNKNQTKHDQFWESDLSEIESQFLDKGQKITDLPTHMNKAVPLQGSVLLNNVYQYNESNNSFIHYLKNRIYLFFHK